MFRSIVVLVAATVVLAVAGCGSNVQYINDLNMRIVDPAFVNKHEPNANYMVDPPDKLKIEADNIPELTPRDVIVRQDGYITLPLLQDVRVQGLTPTQIKKLLETEYSRYYTKPQLLVTVSEFNSKRIYVYGEIAGKPGTLPYTGSETILQALGAVGGVTNRAAIKRCVLSRGDLEHPEVYKVNLKKLLYEGDASQNVLLAENDVLYIPPNAFAWVGYQLENLFFPLQSLMPGVYAYGALRATGGP
jgi:polysaccharide biosynthesis/export protein